MLNKTAVVKLLVAAYGAKGVGVDHRTVSGDGWVWMWMSVAAAVRGVPSVPWAFRAAE